MHGTIEITVIWSSWFWPITEERSKSWARNPDHWRSSSKKMIKFYEKNHFFFLYQTNLFSLISLSKLLKGKVQIIKITYIKKKHQNLPFLKRKETQTCIFFSFIYLNFIFLPREKTSVRSKTKKKCKLFLIFVVFSQLFFCSFVSNYFIHTCNPNNNFQLSSSMWCTG